MQDIETVELRSLHCIKLRMNVSPPASSYVVPPGRSQRGRMGLLQKSQSKKAKSKVAVIGDKAEEEAGTGKDTTTHRGAWWQGSEGRASLPPIQHPHQSSATWPEETGRTLGHQHCDHNISRQRSLEERVFRSTMRGQRVDLSKGHPRPTVLTSQQGQPSTDTAPVIHAGRGNAWDSCHDEETKGQQGTSQGAGNQLPPRSFLRARKHISPAEAQGSLGCTRTGSPHALVPACTRILASLPSAAGRTKPYVHHPLTSSHLPLLSRSSQRPLQQDTAR